MFLLFLKAVTALLFNNRQAIFTLSVIWAKSEFCTGIFWLYITDELVFVLKNGYQFVEYNSAFCFLHVVFVLKNSYHFVEINSAFCFFTCSFRIKEWLSNLKFALWNYTTSKYRRFFIWFSFSRKYLVHLHIVRFKTQTVLENSDCYLHVLEWCRHEKVKFNDLKSFQCFESYYKSYFVYM